MSVPLIPVSTGDASFRRTDQLIVIATMDTKDNSVMVTCTYYLWFSLGLFKIILNTSTQNVLNKIYIFFILHFNALFSFRI